MHSIEVLLKKKEREKYQKSSCCNDSKSATKRKIQTKISCSIGRYKYIIDRYILILFHLNCRAINIMYLYIDLILIGV
jgi:hypothetical protein